MKSKYMVLIVNKIYFIDENINIEYKSGIR